MRVDSVKQARKSTPDLMLAALHGFLVARDAAFNLRDLLVNPSSMAFLAVKDCEKELDKLERRMDEEVPETLTRAPRSDVRANLAALKLTTDLERIGDLIFWVAQSVRACQPRLSHHDSQPLVEMTALLESMLGQLHIGFMERDLKVARSVLNSDSKMDQLRHSVFQRHLEHGNPQDATRSINVLLMVQSLERAGDHVKNLAEELFHVVEGHSLRHAPARQREREFAAAGKPGAP